MVDSRKGLVNSWIIVLTHRLSRSLFDSWLARTALVGSDGNPTQSQKGFFCLDVLKAQVWLDSRLRHGLWDSLSLAFLPDCCLTLVSSSGQLFSGWKKSGKWHPPTTWSSSRPGGRESGGGFLVDLACGHVPSPDAVLRGRWGRAAVSGPVLLISEARGRRGRCDGWSSSDLVGLLKAVPHQKEWC